MTHQVQADLTDLKALAGAVKDLQWYTGPGGYALAGVTVEANLAVWSLDPRPEGPARPLAHGAAEPRQRVEPGDQVVVETKGQQLARRHQSIPAAGVTGTVFRVLTGGPHPHGMKVELRDGTVGRVQRNLTVPGAGEPTERR